MFHCCAIRRLNLKIHRGTKHLRQGVKNVVFLLARSSHRQRIICYDQFFMLLSLAFLKTFSSFAIIHVLRCKYQTGYSEQLCLGSKMKQKLMDGINFDFRRSN
ncbi:putative serine/threonine-protein kinase [Dirofilaria immitis]